MPRQDWVTAKKEYSIEGVPALRNKKSGELCCFGLWGQVWRYSDDQLAVLFYGNRQTFNKINKLSTKKCVFHPEGESIFKLSKSHMKFLTRVLEIPGNLQWQTDYAYRYDNA